MAEQPEDNETAFPVHYIKSGNYHELSCDGAIGGLTPKGDKIWMSLYAERYPLPRTVKYKAKPTENPDQFSLDETAPPLYADTREGLIRSVEVSAYFDIQTATRLRDWLSARISQLEEKSSVIRQDNGVGKPQS